MKYKVQRAKDKRKAENTHSLPFTFYLLPSQYGYTLIELLVVVSLSIILLVAGMSIFFSTLIGGGKTSSTGYVKQVGEHTMTQLTYLIRNARKLTLNQDASPVICETLMSSIGLINQDAGITIIKKQADSNAIDRIASNSGYLTPDDLTISSGPTFDCSPDTYGTSTWNGSPPTITVKFTLRKGTPNVDKDRDIVEIPFESSITLRNL